MKVLTSTWGVAGVALLALSCTAAATPGGNGHGNGHGNGNGNAFGNSNMINPTIGVPQVGIPQIMQSFSGQRGNGNLAPVFSHQLPTNAITRGGADRIGDLRPTETGNRGSMLDRAQPNRPDKIDRIDSAETGTRAETRADTNRKDTTVAANAADDAPASKPLAARANTPPPACQ